MRDLIRAVLDAGMDIGTRTALQHVLYKLEMDPTKVDELYVHIKNDTNVQAFSSTPYGARIIFLPQCLRNAEKCRAPLKEEGFECLRCGSCIVPKVMDAAQRLGYAGVFVAPGGSMVHRIIRRRRPRAVMGVACMFELAEGAEKISMLGLPIQGVPLLKDGCRDTLVDIDAIIEVMEKRK
ncbi:MAG: DUF116 domain-containing protein [Euryarchaeota archaeon]|nr:DUF116 domain-containing protein [Euryarchaeota archaeon]